MDEFYNHSFLPSKNTRRFIMFSLITNTYNKNKKGPTLMKLFTATGKLKKVYFSDNYRCTMRAPRVTRHTAIRCSSSSAVNGRPLDFCSHRHPVSVNCLCHATMALSVGGSFAYCARNARRTITTGLLVWYSNTQNDFSPGTAIFSLHTLASPSGRNVNYNEKQLTGKPDVWLTVHRNSVWIRKTN